VYTCYAISFSKPDMKKLDKTISRLTKETHNIPKSTANILTHFSHEDVGSNVTSFLL
jgi:hypothetical protein